MTMDHRHVLTTAGELAARAQTALDDHCGKSALLGHPTAAEASSATDRLAMLSKAGAEDAPRSTTGFATVLDDDRVILTTKGHRRSVVTANDRHRAHRTGHTNRRSRRGNPGLRRTGEDRPRDPRSQRPSEESARNQS